MQELCRSFKGNAFGKGALLFSCMQCLTCSHMYFRNKDNRLCSQPAGFASYWINSIHLVLNPLRSLYSNANSEEVVMFWSYVHLEDGTQFAYSETREDGTVRVAVERSVDFGFDHAECFLPAVKWFNVEGFTADDLDFLTEFVWSNAPLIFEHAGRRRPS